MATTKSRRSLAAIVGAGAAAVLVTLTPRFEGEVRHTYRDIGGVLSYCDGATENPIEGHIYTHDECIAQLDRDLARHADGISKCVELSKLSDGQKVAYVDFAFNEGVAAFCSSSAAKKANAGDIRGSCDALLLYDGINKRVVQPNGRVAKVHIVVKGLKNRREAEREICLKGLS